jgi:hypothetical protein
MRNEKRGLTSSQSDTQGGVDQFNFFIGESADIICQQGFKIIFISLIDSVKITSFHKSNGSRYKFWYDSTSIASRFSLSALRLISSISCASDIFSLPAEIGKKRISALPAGTSGGTSMVSLWLTGISTVCVMLMGQI